MYTYFNISDIRVRTRGTEVRHGGKYQLNQTRKAPALNPALSPAHFYIICKVVVNVDKDVI
jgi:hypothetical protein